VAFLLAVLAVVLLYAAATVRRRRGRNEWNRSLDVAFVLVRDGPVDPVAIELFRARAAVLEERLAAELHRHRATPDRPFRFVVRGPVDQRSPRPQLSGDGVLDLASHTWNTWRWTRAIDRADGFASEAYDTRIYVVVRAPRDSSRRFVEGASEQGGAVGTLEVDLDTSMVDYALFVATHELFHTVGALDKYDATGRTTIPDGLPEPNAPWPQMFADPMARGRVLSPGREEPPDSLDVLRVGPLTAKEIGWVL